MEYLVEVSIFEQRSIPVEAENAEEAEAIVRDLVINREHYDPDTLDEIEVDNVRVFPIEEE